MYTQRMRAFLRLTLYWWLGITSLMLAYMVGVAVERGRQARVPSNASVTMWAPPPVPTTVRTDGNVTTYHGPNGRPVLSYDSRDRTITYHATDGTPRARGPFPPPLQIGSWVLRPDASMHVDTSGR